MMTGRHKNRGVNFRPDPDLKERFKAATTQAGTSMAAELTAFVRWYVGDTDELPNRDGTPLLVPPGIGARGVQIGSVWVCP